MTWQKLSISTFPIRPKKKIVVFQVPCKKKTGSVGRLFFFFFFFFFFLLTVQTSSFPSSSPLIKYRQCHQAVDPGDMYYGRSFMIFYKQWEEQRSQNASLGHPLPGLHRVLMR